MRNIFKYLLPFVTTGGHTLPRKEFCLARAGSLVLLALLIHAAAGCAAGPKPAAPSGAQPHQPAGSLTPGQTVTARDSGRQVEVSAGKPYLSALGETCYEALQREGRPGQLRAMCLRDGAWVLIPAIFMDIPDADKGL